jgi:membrane protein
MERGMIESEGHQQAAPAGSTNRRGTQAVLRDFGQFARRLALRFFRDGCLDRAGALSFTSVLSLVPAAAISLAFLSAVPQSAGMRADVEFLIAGYLLPHASDAAINAFRSFVTKAGNLTGFGFIGLAITALMLLWTVNSTFDTIWRVTRPRPLLIRLLAYWAILTIGPLLIGGALSLSASLLATGARYGGQAFAWSMGWITPFVPFLLETIAFTLLYLIAPNRRVLWLDALAGGLVAAAMFEAVKYGLALYIGMFPTYGAIYGAIAAIPVVLVWIYLCWIATLLGAEVAATLPEWRTRDEMEPEA